MKWMIASDIHGSACYCEKLLAAYAREKADRLILLGDLLYHGPRNDLPRDYAVFITADEILLRQRLIERKMRGDKTHEQAALFYQESDGPNVRLCLSSHLPCDLELQLLPNGTFMQRS